jgi:hypothetical protein
MNSPALPPTPGEHTPGEQAIARYHRRLTEALAHLDTATTGTAPKDQAKPEPALEIVTAARDLATAVRPLIEHLPAITAALDDAAVWREDDDGWCHGCTTTRTPDRRCPDHTNDQSRAAAYRAALNAITLTEPPPRR